MNQAPCIKNKVHVLDAQHFINQCETYARQNFSLQGLRVQQKHVLTQIYENNFVLATLPTGAGKTLLYSLPALVFQNQPVLVISPLISLMRDQERRMQAAQIPCVILTSEQSEEERKLAWQQIYSPQTKIIFVSPERFVLSSFTSAMCKIKLGMVVVDEAHCVVSWGHQFRPEYSEIAKILSHIQPPRVLALTATASKNTRAEIIKKVFPHGAEVTEYTSHPLAEHIFVRSIRLFSKEEQWEKLLFLLKTTPSQKTLVYFSTRQQCEDFARKLQQQGFSAFAYHAGLLKDQRKQIEESAYSTQSRIVICATTAFGMGVDVSGIRLVIVYGFPGNIEEFFQMLGRAGRGGESSQGVLLWTGADPVRRDYQFKETFPAPAGFLKNCYYFMHLFPTHFFESRFVDKDRLLQAIQGLKTDDINKKLENMLAGLRICEAIERPKNREPYLELNFSPIQTLQEVLKELPAGPTKRQRVLGAMAELTHPEWSATAGARFVFSLRKLAETSGLRSETCTDVLLHYAEKKILSWQKIDEQQIAGGVIFKTSYLQLQKEVGRYTSVRYHFHASLQELNKLSTSTTCRLAASFDFFTAKPLGSLKKQERCGQCDLCRRVDF